MKITYTNNPLNAKLELNSHDLTMLKTHLELEELHDVVYWATHHLKDIKNYNLVKALEALDIENVYKEINRCLPYYLEDLNLPHLGDCTAFACACTRCQAESYMGIDTTKDISKSMGSIISELFRYNTSDNLGEIIIQYEKQIKDQIDNSNYQDARIKVLTYLKEYKLKHNL